MTHPKRKSWRTAFAASGGTSPPENGTMINCDLSETAGRKTDGSAGMRGGAEEDLI
ncbi:MAG: hypothetical protein SPF51_01900 [Candidatus Fimivicinus sp.]|nr:hypothetical protein [Oscillospiraceae bacterium]MDY5590288.1 hypothetical protein [Candidatus Fimivicinus sp.]